MAENEIIKRFYEGIWIYLFSFAFSIVIVILFVIYKDKLLPNFSKNLKQKLVFLSLIFIALIAGLFFLLKLLNFGKDYTSIKNRSFETITGEVIAYSFSAYVETGDTIYNGPIIRDSETGYVIKLNVIGTKLHETYTIIYLKNTKIGAIVEWENQ